MSLRTNVPAAAAAVQLSICVVRRDGDPPLEPLLASLAEQSVGADTFEIVLVDASRRGGVELSPTLAIERVTCDADLSHGAMRNLAWRAASSDNIAFLAADLVPTTTWVEALVQALHRGRHLVRGNWLPASEDVSAGGAVPRALWWSRRSLPIVTSEQMACLRSDLERVNGFAEDLLDPDVCDTELATRLVDAGVDPVWARHAVVFHPVDRTGLGTSRARIQTITAVLAEHPRARGRLLLGGVLWHRYQVTVLLLLAGLGLARRDRRALVLALPWLHERTDLTPRAGGSRRRWALLPGVLALDIAETSLTTYERLRPPTQAPPP
jgi:hypothetical protein